MVRLQEVRVGIRCLILRVLDKQRSSKPYGGVAQLGEHLPCTQGVRSSNLLISTMRSQKMTEQDKGL